MTVPPKSEGSAASGSDDPVVETILALLAGCGTGRSISPEEAADMVGEALIYRNKRIATKLGVFGQVVHAVAPKLAEIVINTGFRMFPDSAAAQGKKDESASVVSPEQMAFAYLMRGVHW